MSKSIYDPEVCVGTCMFLLNDPKIARLATSLNPHLEYYILFLIILCISGFIYCFYA